MQEVLRLAWRVSPLELPRIWLHCGCCAGRRPFICSEKFRINAQKKRLDAWLIYRCAGCDQTWNYPIFERRAVADLEPAYLDAMMRHAAPVARRYASDLAGLRRYSGRIDVGQEIAVHKQVTAASSRRPVRIEIAIELVGPCGLRLDRFLAAQLGVGRNVIRSLCEQSLLILSPLGPRALRQPLRHGQRIEIELGATELEPSIVQAILGALA